MKRALSGRRLDERPAGEAKPNVGAVSDGKAGPYCTVGLVFIAIVASLMCELLSVRLIKVLQRVNTLPIKRRERKSSKWSQIFFASF